MRMILNNIDDAGQRKSFFKRYLLSEKRTRSAAVQFLLSDSVIFRGFNLQLDQIVLEGAGETLTAFYGKRIKKREDAKRS